MKRLLALVIVLAMGGVAEARDVYLNGVKLDPNVILKNQTFPACEVKFDADGNVFITAKGFKVQVTATENAKPEDNTPPSADGKLAKRYWLVSKHNKKGQAQYDVDIFVNDTFVKKVRANDDATVLEVTKFVKAGANKVRLVAVKNLGDRRLSSSVVDFLEIVVGEGAVGGGTVTIDKAVVSYKRTAAEVGDFKDDFSFTGR